MLAVTGSCVSNHARTGLLFSQQARSLTRIEFSVPLCLCAELLLGETVGLGDGADGDRVVPHRASGGRLPRWLKLPGLRESLKSGSTLPPIATKLEKGLGKAHEVARSIIGAVTGEPCARVVVVPAAAKMRDTSGSEVHVFFRPSAVVRPVTR